MKPRSLRCRLFGHDWKRDLLGMDGTEFVWGVRCAHCWLLKRDWTVVGEQFP